MNTPFSLYRDVASWRAARGGAAFRDVRIGFVPTMGALHAGHASLLERARRESDRVVLSIFVNPTQFDDLEDLSRYPRTLAEDLDVAGPFVTDVLMPGAEELYGDGYRFRVTERDLSREMEGAARPGHFDGVLTVVTKLLNLVQPHRLYLGEKDWQQLELIRGLCRSFFVPTEVVACPTVRDRDGLALSSRNVRLSAAGRARAARFPAILREAADGPAAARQLAEAGLEVDYVTERGGRRLAAIRVDGVRLIDNVAL
jgi:pantoate--beta-alanine ligase